MRIQSGVDFVAADMPTANQLTVGNHAASLYGPSLDREQRLAKRQLLRLDRALLARARTAAGDPEETSPGRGTSRRMDRPALGDV
jgi:hypothetical protein